MNIWAKRGTMIVLAAVILVMGIAVPYRKAEAAMTYNNTTDAYMSASVDSNGNLEANLLVNGKEGITSCIEADLYVERKILGVFWTRVEIGYSNNVWHDSTTSYLYQNAFSTNLSSTGTYRVTVTYTVHGSGGSNDSITKTSTVNY